MLIPGRERKSKNQSKIAVCIKQRLQGGKLAWTRHAEQPDSMGEQPIKVLTAADACV